MNTSLFNFLNEAVKVQLISTSSHEVYLVLLITVSDISFLDDKLTRGLEKVAQNGTLPKR